jgi:ATP-dependent HslUV protease subunit HslV
MTIIAYRDGIIAADTLACAGNSKTGYSCKLARSPHGALCGMAGPAAYSQRFRKWFEAGRDGDHPELSAERDCESSLIIVETDGKVFHFFAKDPPYEINAPYIAIGSGCVEARGAMAAGASAIEAVKAAIAHDCHCGGDIMWLSLAGDAGTLRS